MALQSGRLRSVAYAAVLGAIVAGSAGCGSDDDAAATSGAATTAASDAPVSTAAYDGPEAGLPKAYPAFRVTGEKVKIGISCPVCSVPGLAAQVKLQEAEIRRLGGTPIVQDAQGSVQTQLSQMKQLIVQGAQAIIVQPLDSTSMAPVFRLAKSKGVAVIGISTPGDVEQPLPDGLVTNVEFGLDQMAFNKMRYLAGKIGKGAQFGVVGFAVPNPAIAYQARRYRYWGERFGLTFATQVDVQQVTPSAGQVAGTSMFSRKPDVKAVVAFSDEPASGVAVAARLARKTDVLVCGNDYDANGQKLVAAGKGCSTNWAQDVMAKQTVSAAYQVVTKQNLPLPKQVTTGGGTLATPDNYKTVKPF
jgi:ABC-type sugar transport system substrate-binding protein